jgi:predicted enzyme related to lactoylglutathione lyase
MAKAITGKFVWFELMTGDVQKAKAFYGELFGWTTQAMPMGPGETYEIIQAGSTGIGGYAKPQGKSGTTWHSYVSVKDVDAAVKAIAKAGGKVLMPAFDVPNVGRMAAVADPQGATFSVFRSAQDDAADGTVPNGGFMWNELWTTDDSAAVSFYEKTLGYTHKDVDMGPAGIYRVLEQSGGQRGGIMRSPDAKVSPMWLPYVRVEKVDETVARAKKLGGKVVAEPTDIPNIGRFAIVLDPQGAAIAVMRPAQS